MSEPQETYKVKNLPNQSAGKLYRRLYYGDASLGYICKAECLNLLCCNMPGAPGLLLRKWTYPGLFAACEAGTVFGRNLTLRHARKIRLGRKVVLDDGVVLDAKGDTNQGISIGNNVYIGRNTIIYTKNGNIRIGDNVNISSNCQIFSSGDLEIGDGTLIAAFSYLLNGGTYETATGARPFAEQEGTTSKGPTRIGNNCWIAAHATITDGVSLGNHCVIAAGSVVLQNCPADTLCGGLPAKVLRALNA